MKYAFGEFELNPATRELLRNGVPVALRPRSLECLVYLIEHRDRAVGRDELIAAVWGKVDAGDTVVAQTLLRARKALDDTGNQQAMIRTLPRFGYRWVAPVREVAATDAGSGYGADVASSATGDLDEYAAPVPVSDGDIAEAGIERAYAGDAPASAAATSIGEDATPQLIRRRRAPRIALAACLALLVLAGLGWWLHRQGAKPVSTAGADDAVLVMPVAVAPMDSESAWVRLGAMDYMAARLRGSGINVLPSEQALRLATAIEAEAPAAARAKLRALSGARWIALPEMRRQGDTWSLRLRVLDGGNERTLDAHGDSALAAAAAAADAWLRQMGEPGSGGPPPGPVAERLHRIDAEILGGHLTEARRLVRSATPGERSDPRFLLREGKLEFRAGNLDAAARAFGQALDRAPGVDRETEIGAVLGLASVERARNDLDAAEARYTQALSLLGTLPADRIEARMLGVAYQGRGIIRAQRGELDASASDMGQARVWLQRSGDLITLAVVGHNLGKVEALRGDYVQALREFDRSIDAFERFRVTDYLANSLHEKAEVQLALARPADADASIRRTDAVLPKLEDDVLAADILTTRARVELTLGRLRDAAGTLAALRARGVADADPRMLELRLRLHLARGESAQARQLAAAAPTPRAEGGLLLAGVQAAVRGRDPALAKAWLSAAARGKPTDGEPYAVDLAQALVERAERHPQAALARAERASARSETRDSPDREIQAGVVRAMVLLDTRQYSAASAIVGELEKYSETDYRVAWVMLRLYQALGDAQAVLAARGRAQALSGERDLALEPEL